MTRPKRKGKTVIAKAGMPKDRDLAIRMNRDWFVANILNLKVTPPDWSERIRHATRCPGVTLDVLRDAFAKWDRADLSGPLRLLELSFKDPEAFEAERLARLPKKKSKRRQKISKSAAPVVQRVRIGLRIQLADRCRFCQGALPANPLTRNGHRERGVCVHCISQVPPRPVKEPRERGRRGKSVWAQGDGWNRNSTRHRHR